ncbi:MAG TPA: hypothetical protein VM692_11360 [Gammaproteobacteria bacterium]|nr:hypothetical protein [Gammaproteobacteria bacterium]
MVSFEVRTVCIVACHASALVAATSWQALDAQPADADGNIIAQIESAQAEGGPYSADLLDPLKNLGFLYEERGEYQLAAAALERARQVVRANYGLTSLDQAPLLEQQIRSEEALGRFREVWDLEQSLLSLAKAHPEDLRTVPILRDVGDRRMDVLTRYLAGDRPPQIVLGCFYAPEPRARADGGRCDAGSRSVLIQSIVSDAQTSYLDAIRVMLRHELYSSAELRELEMRLVASSYEHDRYDAGRQSLRRLLAYSLATPDPRSSQIEALVHLADWELLFELDQVAALESYARAFELLSQDDTTRASIERIFAPEIPAVLPVFAPNPLASTPSATSAGYVDVAFDITRFGRSRNIEILSTSTISATATRESLVQLIARSRFRPRAVNGELARSAPIVLRYYVDEPLPEATGPGEEPRQRGPKPAG